MFLLLLETNLSLFSRRTGGRLGEEGRGDEGPGGAADAPKFPNLRIGQSAAISRVHLHLFRQLLELPPGPFFAQAAQVIGEEDAVQVVDLVADGAGEVAFGFELEGLA